MHKYFFLIKSVTDYKLFIYVLTQSNNHQEHYYDWFIHSNNVNSVEYLGVILDEGLHWNFHINQLSLKLIKVKAMFCKICHYVNETILRSVYHAIFQSHLSYVCIAWHQNIKYNHKISILQRKAMRIIFSSDFNDQTTPLFSKAKIFKFIDFIQMETSVFLIINLYLW